MNNKNEMNSEDIIMLLLIFLSLAECFIISIFIHNYVLNLPEYCTFLETYPVTPYILFILHLIIVPFAAKKDIVFLKTMPIIIVIGTFIFTMVPIYSELSSDCDYFYEEATGILQSYSGNHIKINNETWFVSDWFQPDGYPPLWVENLVGKKVHVEFMCGCGRRMVIELKEVG